MNTKNIETMLVAASAGAVMGSAANGLMSKLPIVGGIPLVGTIGGALAGMAAGRKFGGKKEKNAAMLGLVGFVVASGTLNQLGVLLGNQGLVETF